MEWVILVAEEVVGKSKFPHSKIGKFERYKPWPYTNANKIHKILYAKNFILSEKEALFKANLIAKEIFDIFAYGLDDTQKASLRNYTVTLYNVTQNISNIIATTYSDLKDEKYLYPNISFTPQALNAWGVVKGLK